MTEQRSPKERCENHDYPYKNNSAHGTCRTQKDTPSKAPDKVVVVGSLNMDYVLTTERLPRKGETLPAHDFSTVHGGKGMNQAVAIARLGGNAVRPVMVGCLGKDRDGDQLVQALSKASIAGDFIQRREDFTTGIAFITVSDTGDNTIVVHPGSNHGLSPQWVRDAMNKHRHAAMVVLQMEIPLEVVQQTIDTAYDYGIPVVLNPSPFKSLPKETLEKVHTLVVNQVEAEQIAKSIGALPKSLAADDHFGHPQVSTEAQQHTPRHTKVPTKAQQDTPRPSKEPQRGSHTPPDPEEPTAKRHDSKDDPDPRALVAALSKTKIPHIILTHGDQGVYYNRQDPFSDRCHHTRGDASTDPFDDHWKGHSENTKADEKSPTAVYHQPAKKVSVVDPTAAGDSFLGAYVAGRSLGYSPEKSIAYGIHAGAFAVTKSGAQPSIPTKKDLLSAGWQECPEE